MKSLNRLLALAVIFALACISTSYAANASDRLVDKVPADTTVLIAFEGTDNTKEVFDKTTLGKIWNTPSVQSFYTKSRDAILKQAKVDESMTPDEQAILDRVKDNIGLFISRPAVMGVITGDEEPSFLIIDAGSKKAQFVELISEFEQLKDQDEIKDVTFQGREFKSIIECDGDTTFWGWDGEDFLLFTDDEDMELGALLLNGSGSQNSDHFAGFYHTDSATPFLSASIEIGALIGKARQDIPTEEVSKFDTIMDSIGFGNLSTLAFKMALKEPDVLAEAKLNTLGAPKGILSYGRSVDVDTLNMLHGSTMDAVAMNYDLAACYRMVADLIKNLDAGSYATMAAGIEKVETELGIKIRGVFPDAFSGALTFNMIPAGKILGAPQGAFAIVAELEDVESLEQSLIALGKYAAGKSDGMLQVASEERNGRKYHAWVAMPLAIIQMMPTWTIVDDKLVIASCKEMCIDAAERFAAGVVAEDSLANNEDFKAVMNQAPSDIWMFRFTDTEVKAKHVLTSMQSFWPLFTMGLMQEGVVLPSMLPSIDDAIKDAPPSFQYYYSDSSGLQSCYQGLGVELNSGFGGGAGSGAMMAAIMMPALGKTKELSKRLVSGTNLKGIGTACHVYAFDYDDNFPPNLEVLITECDVSPKSLESPIKPNRFDGPVYIYIAGQNASMNAGNVLAYENPAYQTEGTNVLFVDGHGEYIRGTGAIELINTTYKRLGKEAPKIEFGTFK